MELNGVKEAIASVFNKKKETAHTFTVCVGMCSYRGVKLSTWKNLRILQECPNPKFEFRFVDGDALIDRSRSIVAMSFIKTNSDYLLFIDDDIVFDPLQIRQMMVSMRENDFDIVGGAYPLKRVKEPGIAIRTLENDELVPFGPDGGLYEVRYISTGCMAIHRRVFESLIHNSGLHLCHPQTMQFYPFFMPMEKEIAKDTWIYLSEDWAFCERAKDLGFKVWVDTTVKLGHVGDYQYTWKDLVGEPKKEVDDFNYLVKASRE